MTKAHRLKIRKSYTERTAGSSPQARAAREREAMAKQQHKGLGLAVPINFLLGCTESELANYQLARLADVANLRSQLHVVLDQVIDHQGLAWLAAWFQSMDRPALKHAVEHEESPLDWAKRMTREGQRSEEERQESVPRPPLLPGAAHIAAALRYQQRNNAEGLCAICPEPLDRNSVRLCTKHLAVARARASQKKALDSNPGSREYLYAGDLPESTHGRQPGTLAALAMNRERKTRAILAEQGIPPESAAVSLRAAREALLKLLPRERAEAMTHDELREYAVIPSKATLQVALKGLRAEERIERIGKGINGNPYRYFLAHM
jgi:hypothetical protein